MRKNINKKINNITIATLTIAIFIFGISFSTAIKKNTEDNKSKDIKISVLINEVGELKEDLEIKTVENLNLYKKIETTSKEIKKVNDSINIGVTKNQTNWKKIKTDLNKSNKELSKLLKEQNKQISLLTEKNNQLKEQRSLQKHDHNILDTLIIGTNAGLTDTIILASINPYNQEITLISIPRDLYYKGRKINELYNKYGVEELQKATEEITGVYPNKYITFNFNSFIDLIDILGGIEINIEKTIVDKSYPGPNNTYTIVTFNQGLYKMDGSLALKYARSRKSTSDFDRSKRQQQIIRSILKKTKELNLLSRLDLSTKIYGKLQSNIKTNINLFEGLSYLQQYQNYKIQQTTLNTSNYLYSTRNSKKQYILMPIKGDYTKIKKYVLDLTN